MTDLVERDSELAEIETFVRRGGVMLIEAGAGVGKTSMLDAACAIARRERRIVLRARGSDLERDFAFGIARQLFERRCADATADERDALLAGPARPVVTLFQRDDSSSAEQDTGFAVLHGLYWLTVNLADTGSPAAGRRRRALGRRGVVALARLPGAAPRRAEPLRSSWHCVRTSPRPDRSRWSPCARRRRRRFARRC